jgi:hypothetical protein
LSKSTPGEKGLGLPGSGGEGGSRSFFGIFWPVYCFQLHNSINDFSHIIALLTKTHAQFRNTEKPAELEKN